MILKHRDTEVLRFDWVEPFGVKNVEVNSAAEQFLPLAFREQVRKDPDSLQRWLEEWLRHRTPPLKRRGIGDMLRYLGFYEDDPSWMRNLITFSRGLSLNDVHWVVKDDSTEKWATSNLYDNPFSTAVASMAFTGEKRTSVRDASTSPEYSTNGNLRKCWRRLNGQVLLYKGGGLGFLVDNDSNELAGLAPIFDNGYGLFSQAISEETQDNEFKDLRKFLARVEPKLYKHWLDIPGGVTDEMIDRLVGLGKFEFKSHPDFIMPDKRLEVSQYFLQNRIAKIIRYREKADRYLSIRRKNVIVNPTISDKLLKKAKESDDLRNELKATLKSFPRAKTEKLAILFKTTTRTIARHLKALKDAGELIRVGSDKTGYWQVIEQPQGGR